MAEPSSYSIEIGLELQLTGPGLENGVTDRFLVFNQLNAARNAKKVFLVFILLREMLYISNVSDSNAGRLGKSPYLL